MAAAFTVVYQYIFVIILGVFLLAVLLLCVRSRLIERRNPRFVQPHLEGSAEILKRRPKMYDVYLLDRADGSRWEKDGMGQGRERDREGLLWRDIMPISLHPAGSPDSNADSIPLITPIPPNPTQRPPTGKQPLPASASEEAVGPPGVVTVTVLLAMPSPSPSSFPPTPPPPQNDTANSHEADSIPAPPINMPAPTGEDDEEPFLAHYELGIADVAVTVETESIGEP
ncbi:hypothetical protein R3P38DRAFT_974790 [Favolaschia claudopus]|uniref:Uncharacterized protein n=1 Tax=Favolaschia claudopus TaxID=2862362 RepID=A0AAW0E3Z2_9AGAR